MASQESSEGIVHFRHASLPGGSAETWYRIAGKLQPDSTPLVLLHGGPGIPTPVWGDVFDKYAAQSGQTVIFYDQVGCGKSTRFPETRLNKTLWVPDLFVDELENLLKALGVTSFDLYGHSWGAMLASYVASTDAPFVVGLRKLILASGLSSAAQWGEAQRKLLKEFPQSVQDAIEKGEREEDYESKEYQAAIFEVYNKHLCRLSPWPEALNIAFAEMAKDDTVYFTMWGPSELTSTGTLKDFDRRSQLHKIKVPTLVVNGEFDEATDDVQKPFFNNIEKVRWITMNGVAHMGYLEQPEKYISIVTDFLSS